MCAREKEGEERGREKKGGKKEERERDLHLSLNPRFLQTTLASVLDIKSSQTVPHTLC